MNRTCTALLAMALLVGGAACNETVEVGSNNGDNNANNGANNSNNGDTNNGDTNNGDTNNANNGDTNNGDTNNANNGDVNNANNSNNGDNNGDVNNGDVNNGDNNMTGCADDAACGDGQICLEAECVAGCRDNMGCTDGTICVDNACIECRNDDDCSLGTVCVENSCEDGCRDDAGCADGSICVEEACVEGCRGDEGCGDGQICVEEACVEGCREDSACADGQICVEEACVEGCRGDEGCGDGQICAEEACTAGCRDDAGCAENQICLEEACQPRGVACREDADCNQGDVCNQEQTCQAGEAPCEPDSQEPNDETAAALEPGTLANLSICPADVDRFQITASMEDTVEVALQFTAANGALEAVLYRGQEELARSQANDQGASLRWVADAQGDTTLVIQGADAQTRNSYALTLTRTAPQTCVDTTLYADVDGDGYGDVASSQVQCLEPNQTVEGLVSRAGDCGALDAWRNPDGYEICGDNLDDDCDGVDMDCPASQPSIEPPTWNCQGEAPSNVYAWARMDSGNNYFQDGGCFIFFEGLPGEFYVKHTMERSNPLCSQDRNGCTCPSLNGWSSYDRRLYAFTLQGTPEDCPDVSLRDHAGEEQAVSNACRKYLYQMHFYDIPYSFVAASQQAMDARIDAFPTVEVACAEDAPHANLPYATLTSAQIVRNPNFQPAQ